MTSEVSRRAAAFIAQHQPDAAALGASLGELLQEPDAFLLALDRGLRTLADADYAAEQERIASGSGPVLGVRWPLIHELERTLRPALAETSSSLILDVATKLIAAPERETRLLALPCLARTLRAEPERSWQLLRRLGRGANDWISIDSIAEVYAQGILAERFRWAELAQLVYSDRRMERRLVGSTLARLPHLMAPAQRSGLDTTAALELIGQLMGDDDTQVQKSLAWALRSWSRIDPAAVTSFLEREAGIARQDDDGFRAWVVRDSLGHLRAPDARRLRTCVAGIRRRPGRPSTSTAAAVAEGFGAIALADRAVAQQGDRFARSRT